MKLPIATVVAIAMIVLGLAIGIAALAAHFSVKCPRCGKAAIMEPVSSTETNTPTLGGSIKRQTLMMKCPYCGLEFKAHAEKMTYDVQAIELQMPEKLTPPPIPLTIPDVSYTNIVVVVAPETYRLRVLHATNMDLQALVDMYSTNRTGMSVLLMERKP
jgi:endogenous inhibitor of DNA gyrase (YacG/DUF329 family)